MKQRTKTDLLRQTITRYWKFNVFTQKPYKKGYNFINLFKIYYLIEIFLTSIRQLHSKTRNDFIYKFSKKATHRLDEISSYKFVNFRLFSNNKFLIFCNISSRTEMFPAINKKKIMKRLILNIKKN